MATSTSRLSDLIKTPTKIATHPTIQGYEFQCRKVKRTTAFQSKGMICHFMPLMILSFPVFQSSIKLLRSRRGTGRSWTCMIAKSPPAWCLELSFDFQVHISTLLLQGSSLMQPIQLVPQSGLSGLFLPYSPVPNRNPSLSSIVQRKDPCI